MRGRIESGPVDRAHRIEAAGLERAVAVDMLPKSKEGLVAQREERPAQRGKDLQLVIGPFDRGEGVAKRDDLLAIMERAPTDKDVRDAPRFQRTDVGPRDVRAEIAEPAEENCDVTWPDRDGAALLFDRPATLVDQPVDEGSDSVRATTH